MTKVNNFEEFCKCFVNNNDVVLKRKSFLASGSVNFSTVDTSKMLTVVEMLELWNDPKMGFFWDTK